MAPPRNQPVEPVRIEARRPNPIERSPLASVPPSDGIIWEEPPPPGARGVRHTALTETARTALKGRPGVWARIAVYKSNSGAHTCAKNITTGKTAGPGWEARHATIDKSRFGVWARWIGDQP